MFTFVECRYINAHFSISAPKTKSKKSTAKLIRGIQNFKPNIYPWHYYEYEDIYNIVARQKQKVDEVGNDVLLPICWQNASIEIYGTVRIYVKYDKKFLLLWYARSA